MTTLTIRLTEAQKRELKARAALSGQTLTKYLLEKGIPKKKTEKAGKSEGKKTKGSLDEAMRQVLRGEVEGPFTMDEFMKEIGL